MQSRTNKEILEFFIHVFPVQWVLQKRNILFKYRRLGTVGIFIYYENKL